MIQLQKVSKNFKGNLTFQNLNLEVKKVEILGLLGANGAGKPTAINMMLDFLNPNSGQVFINDINTNHNLQENLFSLTL